MLFRLIVDWNYPIAIIIISIFTISIIRIRKPEIRN